MSEINNYKDTPYTYKFIGQSGLIKVLSTKTISFRRADKFEDQHECKLFPKLLDEYLTEQKSNLQIVEFIKEEAKKLLLDSPIDKNFKESIQKDINDMNSINDIMRLITTYPHYTNPQSSHYVFSSCNTVDDLRMWINYTKLTESTNQGAVLKFDKKKLEESIKKKREWLQNISNGYLFREIKYFAKEDLPRLMAGGICSTHYLIKAGNLPNEGFDNAVNSNPFISYDFITFPWLQKHIHYKYEKETRTIIPMQHLLYPFDCYNNDKLFIPFGDALEEILLPPMSNKRFEDVKNELEKISSPLKIEMYEFEKVHSYDSVATTCD